MGVYLLEVQAWVGPGFSDVATLRYATETITTLPSHTPANVEYDGRLVDVGQLQRSLFSDGGVIGLPGTNYGYVELSNADGGLDVFVNYAFDGRVFRLYYMEDAAANPNTATLVFRGTVRNVDSSGITQTVRLRIRDRLEELKVPLLVTTYAGTTTSAGPTAEGDSDLAGKLKPQVWGACRTVPPILVNSFDLIYQVSTNALSVIVAQDGGITLSSAGDFASLAALQAAVIAAGSYGTCLSGGYFRLGAAAAFAVTAIVSSANTAVSQAVADLASNNGVTIDTTSLSDLATATAAGVGAFFDSNITILDAISKLLNSVGATIFPTANGTFKVAQFGYKIINSLPAVAEFDQDMIGGDASFKLYSNPETDGSGIPAYKINVLYNRVWKTLSKGELSGSATPQQVQFYANATRTLTLAAVLLPLTHFLSPILTFDSEISSSLDANGQAYFYLQLFSVNRYYITASLDAVDAEGLELNDLVTITFDRIGFNAGRPMLVIGITDNFSTRRKLVTFWG